MITANWIAVQNGRILCYVEETIVGLQSLIESEGVLREAVNLRIENEVTVGALAEMVLEELSTRSKIV